MVKEHYASTFRAHTYLYVEFPWLMRLVDKIINVGETVVKKLSALVEGTSGITELELEAVGRRIDDWGWGTWVAVRAETRRYGANDACIAGFWQG